MSRGLLAFILISVVAVIVARAEEPYKRKVHLEIDAIEGAKSYEIEIDNKGQKEKFKVTDPAWSGMLPPGAYTMRSRSLDYRNVPGGWSQPEAFEVGLEKIKNLEPTPDTVVKAPPGKTATVEMKWSAVGGVSEYQVEVKGPDGFEKKDTVRSQTWRVDLPVAKTYDWKVTAVSAQGFKSEASSKVQILGAPLEKPKIDQPENPFVRDLHWSKIDDAQSYDVEVAHRNNATKKWEKVADLNNVKDNTVPFDAKWPGGVYRLRVKANSEGWQSSPVAAAAFRVHDGDRSRDAELDAMLMDAVDRCNGWCGTAAYLITEVTYSSTNYDAKNPSQANFAGLSGTGRIGITRQKKREAWGFQAIADYSGILTFDNKNLTFGSLEASAIRKVKTSRRSMLRMYGGLFYKELPLVIGDAVTLQVSSYTTAAVIGPHLGVDYSYALTEKLGLQLNLHIYDGLLKMRTPNGEPLEASLMTQIGALASWRMNSKWTGLAGVARRVDTLRYKALESGSGGSTNSLTLQGTYLNLLAEYNF